MRGITVCVDYHDLLSITLLKNLRYLSEIVVVTSKEDVKTQELCRHIKGVRLHITDAFYRNDDLFNKGRALEEGFNVLGRFGWIMVLDADILLPAEAGSNPIELNLYSPYRRMLYDPTLYHDDLDWSQLGIRVNDKEYAGYCQIFNADDPVLRTEPWYGLEHEHAGGCDSVFQSKWPDRRKKRPDWQVLHLGQTDRNWCGRTTPYLDGTMPEDAQLRKMAMNSVKGTYKVPK